MMCVLLKSLWQYEVFTGTKIYGEHDSFFFYLENVIFLLWKYKKDELNLEEIQKSIQKVNKKIVLTKISNCQNKK